MEEKEEEAVVVVMLVEVEAGWEGVRRQIVAASFSFALFAVRHA